MKNVRQNIAKNLVELRKLNKLTQAELAEKLNYSDKAISKWEHGESIPDVEILCQIADIFGVSLDYLVNDEPEKVTAEYKISKERANNNKVIITWLSIFSAILLTFFFFFLFLNTSKGRPLWELFVWMVPACITIALVFNCIWGKTKERYIIISLLMWTLITAFAIQLREYKYIWFIFCFGIPGEIIIVLVSRFGKIKKIHYEDIENNKED